MFVYEDSGDKGQFFRLSNKSFKCKYDGLYTVDGRANKDCNTSYIFVSQCVIQMNICEMYSEKNVLWKFEAETEKWIRNFNRILPMSTHAIWCIVLSVYDYA